MSKLVVRKKASGRDRRRRHIRKEIRGTSERPRLSVFRGNRNISCQLIDDDLGVTLVSATTLEKDLKGLQSTKTEKARMLGERIAARARDKGITRVVFDRGGYKFHGRIGALADAARENGLEF